MRIFFSSRHLHYFHFSREIKTKTSSEKKYIKIYIKEENHREKVFRDNQAIQTKKKKYCEYNKICSNIILLTRMRKSSSFLFASNLWPLQIWRTWRCLEPMIRTISNFIKWRVQRMNERMKRRRKLLCLLRLDFKLF